MRIAHVNQDRGISPSRKKGAAVHLEVMRRAFRQCGAEVVELDEPDEERLAAALRREQAVAAIDLVYERYSSGATAASRFARERDVPFVLEVNSPLALEEELYRTTRRDETLEREVQVFAGATRVLAVSPEVAQYARERGARDSSILVRPNAVDPDVFRPRQPGDEMRARLVPGDRFTFGFHGRLRPWHNFELCVDACERLLRDGEAIHLLLLGEGAFDEAIAGRIPPDRVTTLGWQPYEETARIVACFDALPLAYAPDRPFYFSPLKLLEAMAVRAVPIVPRLSTLPATVGDGERGLVYAPGDASSLAAAMRRLVRDAALRERLGDASRAYAEAHSWRAIAQEIVDLVRAVRS